MVRLIMQAQTPMARKIHKHARSAARLAPMLAASMLLAVMHAAGCESKGTVPSDGPTPVPQAADKSNRWQPTPVAVRVYPSTRFVREADMVLLELRLELLDEMGDPVKASGLVQVALATGNGQASVNSQVLFRWDIDLSTIEDQKQFYDGVTRTYLFRLRVQRQEVASRPTVVRVSFSTDQSQRLTTVEKIRTEW